MVCSSGSSRCGGSSIGFVGCSGIVGVVGVVVVVGVVCSVVGVVVVVNCGGGSISRLRCVWL